MFCDSRFFSQSKPRLLRKNMVCLEQAQDASVLQIDKKAASTEGSRVWRGRDHPVYSCLDLRRCLKRPKGILIPRFPNTEFRLQLNIILSLG